MTETEGWTPRNGHKWGLAMHEYIALRGVACPLCGKRYNRANRPAVVDHNHVTGEIRGVICRQCNEMLGALNERSKWMEEAAHWLRHAARSSRARNCRAPTKESRGTRPPDSRCR